ncbi:MAG: SDR family oxidoreductase [Chloroflexi bacterium]|nr:SDR family oxidoreductase [Chloroflexota bacterium]
MARYTAYELAKRGCALLLAGRSPSEVEAVARDVHIRYGVPAQPRTFDARDFASHPALIEETVSQLGHLDGVFLFFGEQGDQAKAQHSFEEARAIVEVNFLGAVSLLTLVANHLEERRSGVIVGVSSVAGDRGRRTNYVYGSSKGALSLFLQGLRNRLSLSNVQVVTVKPGYVDTAMTYGVVTSRLVASPQRVARGIVRSVEKGRDVVYLPWFWQWIMLVIRLIPERVFKRLNL